MRERQIIELKWKVLIFFLWLNPACMPGAPAKDGGETGAQTGPFFGIVEKIRDALANDPRTENFRPNISVEGGVVTLTGVAKDLRIARAAEQNVRKIPGVVEVQNRLKVETERHADLEIQSRVERDLALSADLTDDTVHVSVINGEVFLSGEVETLREAALAEDIAANTPGVFEVSNKLKTPNYLGPFPGLGYPYRWPRDDLYRYNWMNPDARIREQIETELKWDPQIPAENIKVNVHEGVAILSGVVDSDFQRRIAGRNAYQGGARVVRNFLKVDSAQ